MILRLQITYFHFSVITICYTSVITYYNSVITTDNKLYRLYFSIKWKCQKNNKNERGPGNRIYESPLYISAYSNAYDQSVLDLSGGWG